MSQPHRRVLYRPLVTWATLCPCITMKFSRVCHDPTTMNMCSIGYRLQIIASRVWFHFLACACHNPSCSNPQGCSS